MKKKLNSYLIPGIVGIVIGLFLGYSLSYLAPNVGARVTGGLTNYCPPEDKTCQTKLRNELRWFPWPITISGIVFEDRNQNGIKEAGELGLVDRTVTLTNPTGGLSQDTAPDGTFRWLRSIPAGEHQLSIVLKPGEVATTDPTVLKYWGVLTPNSHYFGIYKEGGVSSQVFNQAQSPTQSGVDACKQRCEQTSFSP